MLANYALGQQVGVIHTPTVFVVNGTQRGTPFVEMLDRAELSANRTDAGGREEVTDGGKQRSRGMETMKTMMVGLIAMVMMVSAAFAGDTSALHPPAGSRMALVVFEDLQCPACAKADPLLTQAERNYGLPLVRHDFVIPNHAWSKEAHIMARYFDTLSPQLGENFRQYIFANQTSILKTNLREWADKFAAAHRTALPAFYDPTGGLRAKVEADTELGKATGVHQTPTIYVVSNSTRVPFVEVTDQAKLFSTIEEVKSALGPAEAAKSTKVAKKK